MKKTFSLFAALLLVFSMPVLGQEVGTSELVNPGITPDSFLYGIDLALENIGLALKFNSDAKIGKKLRNAEERLDKIFEKDLKSDEYTLLDYIIVMGKSDTRQCLGEYIAGGALLSVPAALKCLPWTQEKYKRSFTKIKEINHKLTRFVVALFEHKSLHVP